MSTNASKAPLGLWMATALVVGNTLGSGLFLLPAALAPYGAASLLGWALSGAGAICLAVVFARLGQLHPQTGGPYTFARAAFGDFVGFAVAWSYWVSCWCGVAAIAVAFTGASGALIPELTATPARSAACAIVALWLCTGFNLMGLRAAGWVQALTTVLKLLPLAAIVLIGWWRIDPNTFVPFNPTQQPLLQVTTVTAALTLWAFLGLECATIPADDVRDARRTVPRATVLGTAIAGLVTMLSCIVVMGLLPSAELAASGAPFAAAAQRHWGASAGALMAATAAIAAFGALNGWILIQGQIPLAAARDGLFPVLFAQVDSKGTPKIGVVIGSVLATALVLANYRGSLVSVFVRAILLSTAGTLLPYVVCSAACLKLQRDSDVSSIASHTLIAIAVLAFVYSVWALVGIGGDALSWGLLGLLAGLPVYLWLRWRRRHLLGDLSK